MKLPLSDEGFVRVALQGFSRFFRSTWGFLGFSCGFLRVSWGFLEGLWGLGFLKVPVRFRVLGVRGFRVRV